MFCSAVVADPLTATAFVRANAQVSAVAMWVGIVALTVVPQCVSGPFLNTYAEFPWHKLHVLVQDALSWARL